VRKKRPASQPASDGTVDFAKLVVQPGGDRIYLEIRFQLFGSDTGVGHRQRDMLRTEVHVRVLDGKRPIAREACRNDLAADEPSVVTRTEVVTEQRPCGLSRARATDCRPLTTL
jgi:hypothetical protein